MRRTRTSPSPPGAERPLAFALRALGAVLLAAALTLLAGIPPVRAAHPRKGAAPHSAAKKQRVLALRKRLKSLSQKREVKRAELRVTKRAQGRLADQLNESYQRLETAQQAMTQCEQRLARAVTAVQNSTERLQEAEERLGLQRHRFGRRISSSYQDGPVSYVDVLLGSRNLSDFLDRQYYVSRMMRQDAELLQGLRSAQRAVRGEREVLLTQHAVFAAAREENARHVSLVAFQTAERRRLLTAVQQERALQEQELRELEEDSNGVQHALEQELIRRQANPTAFRNLPRWSGKLFLPSRGPITSGFGYRYHPLLHYRRLHTGIDFGAPAGSPVYAAADGEVFFASWRGGYGRCIILLHGGEMSTLYGHLSEIRVRAGETVHRGQWIGAVGSTGLSTGPHLHFEVRRNGVPINPL